MIELYGGDCLATLELMDDNSVDAIVTDPPYGLSFMGKRWDYDVPSEAIWRECLRVLKPGGHLLAFAGTRTQHRMAVRIEDAGFEIRDMIAWCYASGFPKSHNLDNLRDSKICGCPQPNTHDGTEPPTECDLRPVRDADVPAAEPAGEERGQVLQPSVPQQGTPAYEPQTTDDARPLQPGMEGRCDAPETSRQLRSGAVHQSAGVGDADGASGRLRDGAPTGDDAVVRLPADTDGGSAPHGSRPTEQQPSEPRTVAGQPKPQAAGAWPVCRGCGLPVLPRGLGTALKPALEPITVARKPLVGTVAENVLAHGTGAINVDGCRVEGRERANYGLANSTRSAGNTYGEPSASADFDASKGRWPANLIHDGSEEVLVGFPRSDAGKPSDAPRGRRAGGFGNVGAEKGDSVPNGPQYGDTGSAARFFYCAKASKRDRDEGLEHMEAVHRPNGNKWTDQDYRVISGERPASAESGPRKNIHPTVKPTDLMRYLCRLVTPPGGVVLDPFMGSGSTGKAAVLEGFRFIGCELSPEYLEIARARIMAHVDIC